MASGTVGSNKKLTYFWFGSLAVPSRFAHGTLEVHSKFARGTLEVRSKYCRYRRTNFHSPTRLTRIPSLRYSLLGTVEVHSRYCGRFARSTVEVRSRYPQGSLEVRSRYARGSLLVRFGTLTFYCSLLYM